MNALRPVGSDEDTPFHLHAEKVLRPDEENVVRFQADYLQAIKPHVKKLDTEKIARVRTRTVLTHIEPPLCCTYITS